MKYKFYALKLTAICIIIFILQLIIPGLTEMFILDKSSFVQPWRFLTAIFLHADPTHILFNMFALALFGSILEGMIGGKRFLWVFFVSGIIGNFVAINFYDSSLGASGAIYGIIGALVIIRPWLIVWAFGLPMPMIIAGLIWVVGDTIGLFIPSNVGHIAHLSGIFVGVLIGFAFRKYYVIERKKESNITFDENEIRRWEDNHL